MNHKEWDATMPYPTDPFGTVDPKELIKWGKKNQPDTNPLDQYEEAPL